MKRFALISLLLIIGCSEQSGYEQNLDLVKNGGEAMYYYEQLGEEVRKKDSDSELISRYRSSLKEYCKLDTFGMVQIVKKLRELI